MKCDDARSRFSDLYDYALDPALALELRQHLEGCAACRDEYAGLARATDALRRMGPRTAPPGHVAAVLTAVAAAEDGASAAGILVAPRPWRRAASHLAAALLGAAAVVVLWPAPGREGQGSGPGRLAPGGSNDATAVPDLRLRLVDGRARVSDGERWTALPTSAEAALRAGQRLEVEGIEGLVLEVGSAGELRLTAPPVQPRVVQLTRVVERPVVVREPIVVEVPVTEVHTVAVVAGEEDRERRRELGRTVEMMRLSLDHARAALAATRVRTGPDRSAAHLAQRPSSDAEAGPADPGRTAPGAAGDRIAALPAVPAALGPPDASPVRIRREGDRLSLLTRGSMAVVVPALISRLDDPDVEVRTLVGQRLVGIRDELAATHSVTDVPGRRRAQPQPGVPFRGIFGREERDEDPPHSPSEAWTRWWTENAVAVVGTERGTY